MNQFTEDIFFTGGINTDDDPRTIQKGDVLGMEYCRFGFPVGNGWCIVTSKGNTLINNSDLLTGDRIIGTGKWVENNSIIYYVYKADTIHQIWLYEISTQTHIFVIEGGAFNFRPDHFIHHSNVADDVNFFVDGFWNDAQYINSVRVYNFPMLVDIGRAINNEYTTVDDQAIDFCLWPPSEPVCSYATDTSVEGNKLRGTLWKARTQYIDWNGAQSTWSMISNLALPSQSEFVSGPNYADPEADNRLDIVIDTGHYRVRKINVAISANDNSYGIFTELDKDLLGLADDQSYTVQYFGGTVVKVIANDTDNYWRIPIWANCSELLPNNRASFANFREGYDKIEIDVEVEPVYTEIPSQPTTSDVTSVRITTTLRISNVNLEESNGIFNFQAGDAYAYTVESISPAVHQIQLYYEVTEADITAALEETGFVDQNMYIIEQLATAFTTQINTAFGSVVATAAAGSAQWVISGVQFAPGSNRPQSNPVVPLRRTNAQASLKTGCRIPFGINYYNSRNQDWTVHTDENMILDVPWYSDFDSSGFSDPNNPFIVRMKATIDHVPPIDAVAWKFVYQKPPITNFQQTVITQIVPDGDRWKLSLQTYYQDTYIGATINHTPQAGDILRFIRRPVANAYGAEISEYVPTYFEVEVNQFAESGGLNNSQCIWVSKFDLEQLDPDPLSDQYSGYLAEIYTPAQTFEEGFNGQWKEIETEYLIDNPHQPTRSHGGADTVTGLLRAMTLGGPNIVLYGDHSGALGYTIIVRPDGGANMTGVVTSAIYVSGLFTTIQIGLQTGTVTTAEGTFEYTLGQVVQVVSGQSVSVLPAVVTSTFGNVYVKQRDLGNGYQTITPPVAADDLYDHFFYYIEDFWYSDYSVASRVIGDGRLAIESDTAKLTHQKAAAIHGNTYIDNTGINGLSSFPLTDISSVFQMDEQYGEIFRIMVDGKTLKCLQPRKENSLYLQGSYVVSGDGASTPIATSGQTFLGWKPYESLHGAMSGGAVCLVPGQGVAYYDQMSGNFMESMTNGQINLTKQYKFVKGSSVIAQLFRDHDDVEVRSFVDELNSEVGWAFSYNDETEFYIVTFDFINRRFRSTYSYNFRWFENLGDTLVSFGVDNQLYLCNQDSTTFNGESAVQRVTFVSNERPTLTKRWQNIELKCDKRYTIRAYAASGASYTAQETQMDASTLKILENNFWIQYKRNKYSLGGGTEELKMINGQELRAMALTHELTRDIDSTDVLFSVKINGVLSEVIQ